MKKKILKILQSKDWKDDDELSEQLAALFYLEFMTMLPEIVKKVIDAATASIVDKQKVRKP